MTYLTLLTLLGLTLSVQCHQGNITHGKCANSFLEKRTTSIERKLRNDWFIRCLTTYVNDKSEYEDGDVLSPRCNLAGIGEMCPVLKAIFQSSYFTILGPNTGIHQARFIYSSYSFDDSEYAVLKMKYQMSWIRNMDGGDSLIMDINHKDQDLYNSEFALLYMDPKGKFALLGLCPDFEVNFIMMDKTSASEIKHSDQLADIYKDLRDTFQKNNINSSNYQYLFGDFPSHYNDVNPPYSQKFSWRY